MPPRRVIGATWTTCPSEAGGLQKGQKHPHHYPGTGNSVDGLSKVWRIIEGEDCLLPDRQHNSSSLSVEGGWHSMKDLKWSCKKDSPQVSWEWDNGVPTVPQRCGKSPDRCPIQWQEGLGMEPRGPSMPQGTQALGNASSGPLCKQLGSQVTPIFQPGSLRQGSIWGWCFEGEVARGPQVCLPTSKHRPIGPGQDSKVGRGPDHDHSLLARSEPVPSDHASGSRATEKVQTITVATMECLNSGGNSKGHEKHPANCLGGSHHHLCPEWHQRGNCQESHWFLDKRYQAELPEDVWTVVFFLQWKRATNP